MIIKVSYDIIGKEVPDENEFSDYRYLEHDANNYQPFTQHVQEDNYDYEPTYRDGVISPVDEDQGEVILVTDELTVNDIDPEITVFSMSNHNSVCMNEDIRYSRCIINAGSIFVRKTFSDIIDYKNIFDNFCKNAHSKCDLYIKIKNNYDVPISKWADKTNMKTELIIKDNQSVLKISKQAKNKCFVKINKHGFNCDVANTIPEKTMGLQDRDVLERDHGMLFPYEVPQNVMFHMGTVKFPIDILFIDENKNVKKISKNIKPNTLGTYGCSEIKYVLEIPGGYCDSARIEEGDRVSFSDKTNHLNDIMVEDFPENALMIPLDEVLEQDYSVEDFLKNIKFSKNYVENSDIIKETNNRDIRIHSMIKESKKKILKDVTYDKYIFIYSSLMSEDSLNILIKSALMRSGIPSLNYEVLRVSKNESLYDLHKIARDKFLASNTFILDEKLEKYGQFNIEKEIKSSSEEVLKIYQDCLKKMFGFKKLLNKNKYAYEKVKDKFDVIKSSKGQYKQSVKRLSEKYKAILLEIKKCIQIMNKIKDVRQVDEINSTIVISTRNCSSKVRDVFELVDHTDTMDFFSKLQKNTDDAIKILEDLELNIKRMREFIYANILGKTIISDK
jgi:uncharacterized membrane protein (UPF0127 family)